MATHPQGNFTAQNLLDAAAKLRAGAELLRARGGAAEADLAKAVGAAPDGTDAFCAAHHQPDTTQLSPTA